MRYMHTLLTVAAFLAAGLLAALGAGWAAGFVENRTSTAIASALSESGHDWAEVRTDGLLITLSGTAPTEAIRFRALSIAGNIIDAARVIDHMQVEDTAAIAPPRFSIEMLRNNADVSLIGLVPADYPRETIIARVRDLGEDVEIADMLESANHPVPDGWEQAVDFALGTLEYLTAAKISISAERVGVTALASSREEQMEIEARLSRTVPRNLRLGLDISAPRPVITPFTLRFVIDEYGTRFDACSADTDAARLRILSAGGGAGATGRMSCTVGMGVPSPNWATAAERAIEALAELGAGNVTISDTDVSLIVPHDVSQGAFDRVTGELESALPDVFSLRAVRLDPPSPDTASSNGVPEFVATLSTEGYVELRGRLTDERLRSAVDSYARARFGINSVQMAARLDEELPDGWPLRVLTALEALAELNDGTVRVLAERLEVRGATGNPDASDTVSRILSDKLGSGQDFRINVVYQESLDPIASMPTPESCAADIAAILADRQITFAPGSSNIDRDVSGTLDAIADVLRDCGDIALEVGGHTDSQGRAEMNLALSQARAEAVISALMTRRVLVSGLVAQGYGQEQPIASNSTAAGREANRRIEFRRIIDEEDVPLVRERDPELEATLEIAVTDADEDTVRPAERPARD